MNLDLTSVLTMLRVNGLTAQSPTDQIYTALQKAGYQEEEIQSAIKALTEGGGAIIASPVPTEQVPPYVQPISTIPTLVAEKSTKLPLSESSNIPVPVPGKWSFGDMFQGRISVGNYWKSFLLIFALDIFYLGVMLLTLIVLAGLVFLYASIVSHTGLASLIPVLIGFAGFGMLTLIPFYILLILGDFLSIGLQVRRLHDLGLSGWSVVAGFLIGIAVIIFGKTGTGPFSYAPWVFGVWGVGVLFGLYIAFWPGKKGINAFGEPIQYRSWWAGLIGNKNLPDPSKKSHKGFFVFVGVFDIVMILLALGLVLYGALSAGSLLTAALTHGKVTPTTSGTFSTPVAQGTTSNTPEQNSLLTPGILDLSPNGTPTLQPPKGWEIEGDDVRPDNFDVSIRDVSLDNGDLLTSPLISFGLAPKSDQLSAKDVVEKEYAHIPASWSPSIVNEGPVTIDGVTGYMLEWKETNAPGSNSAEHGRRYDFIKSGKEYKISLASSESLWSTVVPVMEASIATAQLN